MISEQEAKKKYCCGPFAARWSARCLGSECMAWQESGHKYGKEVLETVSIASSPTCPGKDFLDGWALEDTLPGIPAKNWVRREMIRVGYCGLVNQPKRTEW